MRDYIVTVDFAVTSNEDVPAASQRHAERFVDMMLRAADSVEIPYKIMSVKPAVSEEEHFAAVHQQEHERAILEEHEQRN